MTIYLLFRIMLLVDNKSRRYHLIKATRFKSSKRTRGSKKIKLLLKSLQDIVVIHAHTHTPKSDHQTASRLVL